jgi:multicomponent Na+:H+ antiporter subunit E
MIVNLVLRLLIWFLLTSDLSLANIIIGVLVSFLLPLKYPHPETLKEWWEVLVKVFVAIPQAYWEALQMIFTPHVHEEITTERVRPNRSPRLIFLDIFLITFTPKTIVLHYNNQGWHEVHWVRRKLKNNKGI